MSDRATPPLYQSSTEDLQTNEVKCAYFSSSPSSNSGILAKVRIVTHNKNGQQSITVGSIGSLSTTVLPTQSYSHVPPDSGNVCTTTYYKNPLIFIEPHPLAGQAVIAFPNQTTIYPTPVSVESICGITAIQTHAVATAECVTQDQSRLHTAADQVRPLVVIAPAPAKSSASCVQDQFASQSIKEHILPVDVVRNGAAPPSMACPKGNTKAPSLKDFSVALEHAKNDVLNALNAKKKKPGIRKNGMNNNSIEKAFNNCSPKNVQHSPGGDATPKPRQGRMSCSPLKFHSDVLDENDRALDDEMPLTARKKLFYISKKNRNALQKSLNDCLSTSSKSDGEGLPKHESNSDSSPSPKKPKLIPGELKTVADLITISDDEEECDKDDICIINSPEESPAISEASSLGSSTDTAPSAVAAEEALLQESEAEKNSNSVTESTVPLVNRPIGDIENAVVERREPNARIGRSLEKDKQSLELLETQSLLRKVLSPDLNNLPAVDDCLAVISTFARLKWALDEVFVQQRIKLRTVNAKTMYYCSRNSSLEKVIALLAKGCDPTEKLPSEHGACCLHVAATTNIDVLLCLLYASGNRLDIPDDLDSTPLMAAAAKDRLDTVKLLYRCGASLEKKDHEGKSILHICASSKSYNTLRWVCSKVKDINAQDNGGWTALMWAADEASGVITKVLLQYGACPNYIDEEMNHCLHWAALAGSMSSCFDLIKAGSPVNGINIHKETPLHIAVREDYFDIVQLLLLHGADTTIRNQKGLTPHKLAMEGSRMESLLFVKSFIMPTSKPLIYSSDLSHGKERVAVSCINEVDSEPVPEICYVTSNVETGNVHLAPSSSFFKGCDCAQSCGQSVACACVEKTEEFTCWYDEEGTMNLDLFDLDRPMIYECSRFCTCWSFCTNRVVQRGVRLPLQIFRTKDRGWGLRCLEDIPSGTYVVSYLGELLNDEEANKRTDDTYLFDLDTKGSNDVFCIDALRYGNAARFINHSCDANVQPIRVFHGHMDNRFPEMAFFATKNIMTREELCLDYGEKYWSVKMMSDLYCSCGMEVCRYKRNGNGCS